MMQWMKMKKIGKAGGITMDEMYFTIAGCNHYFGNDFLKKVCK